MSALADWVRARFPSASIRAQGEVELTCPWCGKDRKLWFNVIKGRGICFRCQHRCGVAALVAVVDGVPEREARSAAWRLLPADLVVPSAVPSSAACHVDFPEESAPVLRDDNELARAARAYLHTRALSDDDIGFWDLRYCWGGRYAYRVLFPYRDLAGRMIYWAARKIDTLGTTGPKMLYPDAPRRDLLYNLDVARIHSQVVLVEGPIDALHVGRQGVALGGNSITTGQVVALRTVGFREVVVLLDADAYIHALKVVATLLRHPWTVRLARLPAGRKDPGECSMEEVQRAVRLAAVVGADDLPALKGNSDEESS